MSDERDGIIACPKCGHEDDIEGFDCLGACNDNLFCVRCHCEFDPETGLIHKCKLTADEAAINRERGVTCPGVT
jgi:hypothetical protein